MSGKPKYDRELIVTMRRQGATYREITEALGCDRSTVRVILRDAGLTIPHSRPVEERFWEKVHKTDACWEWMAFRTQGYGKFNSTPNTMVGAHRFAYELTKGPVPPGMQLDHLCRNRACVNPAHLEPVTPAENTARSPIAPAAVNARKTHCVRGHDLSEARVTPSGGRACRACQRIYQAAYRARRRAARVEVAA